MWTSGDGTVFVVESPNFHGTIQVQASTEFDAAQEAERTEIHAFNGFVVRRGTELGVPTPVKQTLLALMKLRERQFECAAGHPGD